MTRKIDIVLMILNGSFVVINSLFVAFGSSPSVNLAAAVFCLMGFCIAFNSFMNGEYDESTSKNGK
jgi:hypothetical protein